MHRCARIRLFAAVLLTVVAAPVAFSSPGVALIGSFAISGSAHDKSGLADTYTTADGPVAKDQLGSFGSAITYSGRGNQYIAFNDRGLSNGDVHYDCRMQVFDIAVDASAHTVKPTLVVTHLLTDEKGRIFDGSSAAIESGLRLDPEGVRANPKGTLYVSDEYGPYIYEFDRSGKRIRALKVPAKFGIAKASADAHAELSGNAMGRQANRGFEGLALSPSGDTLFALLQSPLIQDHALNAKLKRVGTNDRLLALDVATGATKEYLYQLDEKGLGINELIAVSDHTFLAIERDGKGGDEAKTKNIYLVDIAGATDISATGTTASNGLPESGIPAGVLPVRKSLLIDLLDPGYGIAGANCPEKFEGLAFGPDLPDGRRLLIVTVDNDLIAAKPSWFYAFAINRAALSGYTKQVIRAK